MDSEGQDSAKGTGEDRQVSNVVQFPRDWIGPPEELIPIGPRADRVAVDDPPGLPSASDFWGEHAAAMHSVLEDPAVEQPAPVEERASPIAAVPRPPAERPLASRPARRARRRPRGVAWIAAALAGAAVILAMTLDQPGRVSHRGAETASTGFLAGAARQLGTSAGIVDAVHREQARTSAAMQRPRIVHRAPSIGRRTSRPSQAPASRSTSVAVQFSSPSPSPAPATSYTAPTSGNVTAASTTSGSGASNTTSSASGTASGSGSTSESGSASRSAPAGPTGPGAPFGPGHLG